MLKMVRQTLLRAITIGIGTATMGFYSGEDGLGSTPTTAWASGDF